MRVFWIVVLPLVVLVAVFAVLNRQPVTVDLFPLLLTLEIPLYLTILAAVFLGFVLGGLASWTAQGKWRRRARERARRVEHLEREISELGARVEETSAQGGKGTPEDTPAPPVRSGAAGEA